MIELEKLCGEALYEEVRSLEDGRSIVRDPVSGRLFFKKRLETYNLEVFAWLKDHRSRYVPRIESYWQEGQELVVIEEMIQGNTLEELLREGVSFQERIRILLELCEGLTFLHSAQPPIIHRDLKPSNIMLTEDGVVKIIDYDAAKVSVKGQTRDTQLIGTQGSAAPEQYGFAASDARTDIYALGKLIERMLPNNADAARIVARATRMDPAKRYASAAQIREPIRRIREHPSGLDSLLEKLPGYNPLSKRHRVLARLFIFLACAVLVGGAALAYRQTVVLPRRHQEALANAVQELESCNGEAQEMAEKTIHLLEISPYDALSEDRQKMVRDKARTVIRDCTVGRDGEKQETGLYLTEEGVDFLKKLANLGVGAQTAEGISVGGQVRYLLRYEQWQKALETLPYMAGLPDEESIRTKVRLTCEKKLEEHQKSYDEDGKLEDGTFCLWLCSLMVDAGYEEAREPFESYYVKLLESARTQQDAEDFATADKILKSLLAYEAKVTGDVPRPNVADRIKENSYLKAQWQLRKEDYTAARASFLELGDYEDSPDMVKECDYRRAGLYYSRKQYKAAAELWAAISGYKDADDLCQQSKYHYCLAVSEEPDALAYDYIEELAKAGYPGADQLRDRFNTWLAEIDTGVVYQIGAEQCAAVRATLVRGPLNGSTRLRFELTDLETGMHYTYVSEEKVSRGENYSTYYTTSSLTENIFEKRHSVEIYADDGSKIGSWSGQFAEEFLSD